MQDFDELASEAANWKPRVLVPRLCLPNDILQSSESNNRDAKIDESINTNKNEDIVESSDMEPSSNSRGILTSSVTRCGDKSPKWLFLIAPWRENFAVASGEKVAISKIWGRRHLGIIMWDNKVFFSISKLS